MKKLFKRLHDWYQNMLPERWRGKNGLAFLFLMWIVIFIFEGFWLVTGETDLYLLLGMPGFFLVITFVIVMWGLELFKKEKKLADYNVATELDRDKLVNIQVGTTCYVKKTKWIYTYSKIGKNSFTWSPV